MAEIRFASVHDIPEIVNLGKSIHAENRLARLPFDGNKLAEQFKSILDPPNGRYCLFVGDVPNSGISGGLLGYVTGHLFSDTLVTTNYIYFVNPEYRGSSLAIRLITAFRKWAENRGTTLFCISQTTAIETKRFDKFMKHIGFEFSGGNFSRLFTDQETLIVSTLQKISGAIQNRSCNENCKIRFATISDIPEIMKIGNRIHSESPMARLTFSAERFGNSVRNMFNDSVKDIYCVLIVENESGITGLLTGYIKEYFFSRACAAVTTLFYITSQYRESGLYAELASAFQDWAQSRGAAEMIINANTGIDVSGFNKSMNESGFEYTGGNYFLWLR